MNENDYKELNYYLNEACIYLEKNDYFFLDNVAVFGLYNQSLKETLQNYNLDVKATEKHLTYQEVFSLAREIIESINPKYLEDYDRLIETGELDFNYERKSDNSSFSHIEVDNNIHNIIDINLVFDYSDVKTLVHEFMHYTNGKKGNSSNRRYLTEFLSIYYENYAIDYLIEKGIPKDEINYSLRLKRIFMKACDYYSVESPIVCFMKFGDVSSTSYKLLNEYFFSIKQDRFNEECYKLLNYFRKKKEDYDKKVLFGEKENQNELRENYAIGYSLHCRYLFGTLLAFYARKHCKKENVLYLNEHINDDIDIFDCLKLIGLDLSDNNFLNDALDSIIDYVNDYNIKKR